MSGEFNRTLEDQLSQFEDLLAAFEELEQPTGVKYRSSRTPGHMHVTVELSRVVTSEQERITLQALLGSDPMRELLNYRRLMSGTPPEANCLFFEDYETVTVTPKLWEIVEDDDLKKRYAPGLADSYDLLDF
jgi:hypothetical protein